MNEHHYHTKYLVIVGHPAHTLSYFVSSVIDSVVDGFHVPNK